MRISCCVPFCRHTRGDRKGDPLTDRTEWICGDHWKFVREHRRRVYARAKKDARETGRQFDWDVAAEIWKALKREAIEKAVGI